MSLPVAILAGGLATRLRPLTENMPKVLLEVAGKPFAIHQLELLRNAGFEHMVYCVGNLGQMVQETLGDGRRFGIKISYVFDGPIPLGTGGAIKHSLPLLGEAFFVIYGDSYLECDYAAIEKSFCNSGNLGLMTIFRNANRWDLSNVLFRDGQILHYDKYNHLPEMEHIDYGIGVLRAQAFRSYPSDITLDLASVYQDLIAQKQLAGFEVSGRFYEIGSPSGLEETRQYFLNKGREG